MTGAQGGAQSELPLPAHRPRQNQVRDVRARDDEDDSGRGKQDEKDGPCGRRELIAKRRDPELNVRRLGVRLGVFAHHRPVQGGQLRSCRFQRDARGQAAEQLGHTVGAVGHHRRPEVMRAGHHVRDDLRLGRIGQRRLEDADHGGGARTESDRLANHPRVAVECGAPETVCKDRRTRRLGTVVGGVQQAAEHRPEPHDLEERPVDDAGRHHTRLGAESDHREVSRGEIAERGNRPGARFEIGNLRHGEGEILGADARGALADVDQAIGVSIDQRNEQHGPHHAENRRVGPDAQSERHDHRDRQALGSHEGAQGKPDVPSHSLDRLEPAWPPDTPNGVASEGAVAEFFERGPARRFRILAALNSLLDAPRHMTPNLVVELIQQVRLHALLPASLFQTPLKCGRSKRLRPTRMEATHSSLHATWGHRIRDEATMSYSQGTPDVRSMLGHVRPDPDITNLGQHEVAISRSASNDPTVH